MNLSQQQQSDQRYPKPSGDIAVAIWFRFQQTKKYT